ncbi:hypothetical protein [Roseibium sp. RKSG952]|uniref:hypothetical protein n=1 Tax=Roseibium sp. RKSG952 TaxID=2529384 RepID=UPI0012BCE679|nr:hypothetical protein [Roseibium sp. RKSG952]MTH95188.1 hypothetical protein [Roseibium sp. RKSG952]
MRTPTTPPSRLNKKQIGAWDDPSLIQAAHLFQDTGKISIQEIIAEAVNYGVGMYGRKPILKVSRDRFVKRKKSRAGTNEGDKMPTCRNGKARIAAWFDNKDKDALVDFCKEVGIKQEALILMGLPNVIPQDLLEKTGYTLKTKKAA